MPLFNYPSAPHWTQVLGVMSVPEASIISLPFSSRTNKSLDNGTFFGNKSNPDDGSGYVKLHPGSKIYFYTTEDENLLIGPKLQSEDDVSILLLDQDEDVRKYSQFNNSFIKQDVYSVLKSGVLVPKLTRHRNASEECNKCVYQSLKPTYYIKGFKSILIPADVLYSKAKQEELFNTKHLEKTFGEPDLWRTDLKLSGLKANSEEQEDILEPKNSHWSPVKNRYRSRASDLNQIESAEKSSDADDDVNPDRNCNGDVTLFLLQNDGVFKRTPSDPFLPTGTHVSYSMLRNFMLKPKFLENSGLELSYITGENGDLIPHSENVHKVVADGDPVSYLLSKNGGLVPVREEVDETHSICYYFNGDLIHRSRQFTETFSNSTSILINNQKVQIFEERMNPSSPKTVKKHHLRKRDTYFDNYDRGGNPGPVMEGPVMRQPVERMMDGPVMRQPVERVMDAPVMRPPVERVMDYPPPGGRNPPIPRQPPIMPEPPMERKQEMMPPMMQNHQRNYEAPPNAPMRYPPPGERYQENAPMEQAPAVWENPPLRPRTDIFTFDEKGLRVRLIPEITSNNDIVIYKLTCKGNLVRYPPCKEPEFGFNIHFQLLLDEFVLVPRLQDNKPFTITYVLQENGDLTPAEGNANSFRKAPGSLIYYILGKNNVLFPVQQIIDLDGYVSFFYQDYFLLKMKDSPEKPLHFTTRGAPLFAFFNGFTIITISSKPRLNPIRGSNWKQLKHTDIEDKPPKTMYLTGPKGELIKLVPYKNKQGSTVVYELDCNGIFYRSPKDKKKCIILRSYMLLKEGILLPSNDTSGYVYMMSKNGDLFPYLYPDGKIEAPIASSLKYMLCEKGILLPIKLEIIDSHICYLFRDVVVYKERVYCKSCLDRLDEEQLDFTSGPRKSSCDVQSEKTDKSFKLFINKDGEYVFYERTEKVLKRHPPEPVPAYLKYTMGSFAIKSDGSLYQVQYQDPNESVVNLMLEPNGDLMEDTRNVNKVRSEYYILDAKGNLISVDVKKTKRHLHFYKNNMRVCRVRIPDSVKEKNDVPKTEEKIVPPLGKDPMGIMADPPPEGTDASNDTRSLYIPIPLKSISIAESPESCTECADKKKYEMLKDTLTQVSKSTSLPLSLELELTDEIIEELKNWATKCDKVISRREVPEELKNYLEKLKLRTKGQTSEAR